MFTSIRSMGRLLEALKAAMVSSVFYLITLTLKISKSAPNLSNIGNDFELSSSDSEIASRVAYI